MLGLSRQQVLVIAAVSATNVAITCWWLQSPRQAGLVRRWLTARAIRTNVFLFAVAGALWAGIFLVYGFPVSGDVQAFYQPQGRAALSGAIPNADFATWYMPLFPYIMGVADLLGGRGSFAIPLFLTGCFVAVGLILPRLSEAAGLHPEASRALVLAGLLNGASWLLAIGYQQDEDLVLLVTAAVVLLLLRGKDLHAGLLSGLALLSTKILFFLSVAALAMQASRRPRFVLGVVIGFVPLGALFLWLGSDPLLMISGGVHEWAPPSLSTLAGAWRPAFEGLRRNPWPNHLIVGAACFCSLMLLRRRCQEPDALGIMRALVGTWLAYLLLSPNSPPTYRILVVPLLPIIIEAARPVRRRSILLFGLYATALGVHWSLFEDWFRQPYGPFLAEHGHEPEAVARFAVQFLIDSIVVGSELYWLTLVWRQPGLVKSASVSPQDSEKNRFLDKGSTRR